MTISKLVDNRIYSPKTSDEIECMKGSTDCMYLKDDGNCSAEWCIYNELPKMTSTSRELTCSICGTNKKNVSLYSGLTSFICTECQTKIKKITPKEKICPICVTNKISIDECICSSCIEKIRSKINE